MRIHYLPLVILLSIASLGAGHSSRRLVDVIKSGLFSQAPYMRGAFFYKAVADKVGAAQLDTVLATFFQAHQGGSARMADMLQTIQDVTGYDPTACAQTWLLATTTPTPGSPADRARDRPRGPARQPAEDPPRARSGRGRGGRCGRGIACAGPARGSPNPPCFLVRGPWSVVRGALCALPWGSSVVGGWLAAFRS